MSAMKLFDICVRFPATAMTESANVRIKAPSLDAAIRKALKTRATPMYGNVPVKPIRAELI